MMGCKLTNGSRGKTVDWIGWNPDASPYGVEFQPSVSGWNLLVFVGWLVGWLVSTTHGRNSNSNQQANQRLVGVCARVGETATSSDIFIGWTETAKRQRPRYRQTDR